MVKGLPLNRIRYDKLRGIIAERGYTRESLAKAAGLSLPAVGNVLLQGKNSLSCRHEPSYKTMIRIIDTLNLTAEEAGILFFSGNLRNEKDGDGDEQKVR